jgi:hypothetical protein
MIQLHIFVIHRILLLNGVIQYSYLMLIVIAIIGVDYCHSVRF